MLYPAKLLARFFWVCLSRYLSMQLCGKKDRYCEIFFRNIIQQCTFFWIRIKIRV